MPRVLILYYSQTGECERAARAFANPIECSGAKLTFEAIAPQKSYPYPWRSIRRFFDEMPECILGSAPPIKTPTFRADSKFDLIVLAYPVWFLSPALPIQGFLKSPYAAVLNDTRVVTLSVSRAMWNNASIAIKRLLRSVGAIHISNVVVTHQGSPIATLVSTPRALLSGKRDALMGVFPQTGVAETEINRIATYARRLAEQAKEGHLHHAVADEDVPAVSVNRWLVIPELVAWYCFYAWARLIHLLGTEHSSLRALGVYGFVLFLFLLIVVGLPIAFAATWLLHPLIRHRLEAYMARVAAPGRLA